MALVGHISGSSQSNSVIGISGSVIVANRPNSLFPSLPGSDVTFFVSGALDNTAVSVFGGKLVVSGGINSTTISGSGDFSVGGDLRIAGDLRVDGNDVKSSTGVTVISFTGSNVVIPGDLTVNGTTVTVSSSNLVIFDQLIGIGFESGSISRANGDRGLIGGLATGDNASVFWDNSESEFAVVRTDSTPESSSVNVVSYAQLHVATLTGSLVKSNALTGSLTKLVDGSDYLKAGTNISLTTGSSGEVTIAVTGLGGGDVFGPASATNDAIAVYDGTTGKLIKNSGLSVGLGTSTQAYVTASVNLTNYGFALIPNGTGSLSAHRPDGLSTGGDSRGENSVDFQMSRFLSSQVASGARSVIVGGERNTASGLVSVVVGGRTNIASASYSFIGAGNNNSTSGGSNSFIGAGSYNTTTGTSSVVCGGEFNASTGTRSFVGAGQYNTGSGAYSVSIGGLSNTAQSYGETSFGLYATSGSGNPSSYDSVDRLLSIGNGTSDSTRSNALTLIKNGNLHISGTLTLMSGSTSGITFPSTRGSNGQVLTSDGAGLITWQTPVSQPSYFTSTTAGSIYTTGSAAFVGNEVGIDAPSDKGSDVSFYVSGSTDGSSIALFGGGIVTSGSLNVFGNTTLGDTTSDLITFNARAGTDFLPANDNQYNLGSATNRWANVYTGDLHLKNDRGDWTVIEEDEYLSLRNNKTGKLYRLVMEPVGE